MDPLEQLKKQIDDLNKRIAALGGEFFKDIDKAIASFGGGIKGAEAALKSLKTQMDGLNTDTNYFFETLKKVTKELKGQKNFNKDIAASYSKLSSIANQLKYDQDGINDLTKNQLVSLSKKLEIERKTLEFSINQNNERKKEILDILKSSSKRSQYSSAQLAALKKEYSQIKQNSEEAQSFLDDQEIGYDNLSKVVEKRLEKEKNITKTLGISGKIVDGIVGSLGKLGISSEFFENLKDDMRDAAKSEDKWKVVSTAIKGLTKGIGEALKDPVTQLTLLLKLANFFIQAALTANAQSVALGKSLGYGADRADDFREKLVDIERSSNNLNVTTKNLVEAYGELAKVTGFAYEFTADQLETQIKLTKQVGLTAEEAAQIQRFGVLNNKTSEETYKSFLKGITAARNQLKVGIDFKATLAEASKVSGQLAAQLGNNPELIGKAVVTAKALGMTLEQVAKAGSSLLDFGTSISSELEAELLTGKELNLERARAAALAGDQITLAEELAKNMGTAADFTKLNKLQQDSLAKSIGMSSDELAETLKKREEAIASGKSLAQITEEEAKEALERQSIQDKFNATVEKLQSLFGNLMAGPLGGFLDMLSGALNIVNYIGNALSFLATPLQVITGLWLTIKGIQLASLAATKAATIYEGMKRAYVGAQVSMATGYNAALLIRKSLLAGELAKTIAIAAAWAVANWPVALLGLGAAAAVSAGLYSMTKGDDVMSEGGYGKRTLLSPEGAIKLNDKDTVIAGTNLGGGEGGGSMPQIDLTPMIMAINEVRAAVDRLYSKDQSINMDGKKVGTTLVQGSYKVA